MLTNNVVSHQDVFDYLGIDDDDDEMVIRRVESLRKFAASFLNSSVGKHLEDTHPTAKELALAVIADAYDNRGTTQRVTTNTRKMIDSYALVLVMEGRENGLRPTDSNPEAEH